MWNDLSLSEKSDLMRTYIRNGMTSLNQMRSHFDSFAKGGPKKTYKEWLTSMQERYPDIEFDSNKAQYDYERYFNENYQDAVSRLNETEARHFTDKYKLPGHPTFSDESVYSQGPMIGGHWTVGDTFVPSTINAQRYPWLYSQNRQYSEAEIEARRAGELYDNSKDNFADLTPIDLSVMKTNRKTFGQNRYIDPALMQDLDNYLVYRGVGLPQRQAILFSVQQEGSTAKKHGNGAYGLVGWRGDRKKEVQGKNARQQAEYLVNTLYDTGNDNVSFNWHHGGRGSGYQNAKKAQDAFINAKTAKDATYALNFGYIRPDYSDRIFREDNVNGMFNIYADGGPTDDELINQAETYWGGILPEATVTAPRIYDKWFERDWKRNKSYDGERDKSKAYDKWLVNNKKWQEAKQNTPTTIRRRNTDWGKTISRNAVETVMSGLAIPAFVMNPVGTAAALGAGTLVGEGVNTAVDYISNGEYKDWGDWLGQKTGTDSYWWNYTNPGYFVGGKAGSKLVKNPIIPSTRDVISGIKRGYRTLRDEGVINKHIKYNPDRFYRIVGEDAIKDAESSGIIKGSKRYPEGPYFAKGNVPIMEKAGSYIIEAPDDMPFISAGRYRGLYHTNGDFYDYKMFHPNATFEDFVKYSLEKNRVNYDGGVELLKGTEPQGTHGFPFINGTTNKTPANMFTYYKKRPFLGWKKYSLKEPSKQNLFSLGEEGSYESSKPVGDLFKFEYQRMLSGEKPILGEDWANFIPEEYLGTTNLIPQGTKDILLNSTMPRMRAMRRGYKEGTFEPEFNEAINTKYTEFPKEAFDKAGIHEKVEGTYYPNTDFINMKSGTNPEHVLPHEVRHRIDTKIGTSTKEVRLLQNAYGRDFNELPRHVEKTDILHNYKNIEGEKVTTNLDARNKLLGLNRAKNMSVEDQNMIIDKASDERIISAVRDANGYGKRFIEYLEKNNKLTTERIKAIREAMKYVGGVSIPIGIGLSIEK